MQMAIEHLNALIAFLCDFVFHSHTVQLFLGISGASPPQWTVQFLITY